MPLNFSRTFDINIGRILANTNKKSTSNCDETTRWMAFIIIIQRNCATEIVFLWCQTTTHSETCINFLSRLIAILKSILFDWFYENPTVWHFEATKKKTARTHRNPSWKLCGWSDGIRNTLFFLFSNEHSTSNVCNNHFGVRQNVDFDFGKCSSFWGINFASSEPLLWVLCVLWAKPK